MARRQVSIFINGKAVENSIKAITSEKRKLSSELRRLTIGTDEYNKKAAELKKTNRIITEHNAKVRDLRTSWDKISKGSITKIAGIVGGAFAADAIIQYGKELFKLGTQMDLLNRKAETVFGDALPAVTRAAEENATAMGITTSQYIKAAAEMGDLLIPMGFMRNEAAEISTNLVDLSGALAEWTGGQIDAENVSRILSKALLGEREELKQLGISILESDVQARLAEKGLKNLTGTMLQQAKATATLELVTEKSADAITAFADNADLSARRQAILTARVTEISEKLATLLIPVFEQLVDVAEAAVNIIDGVVDAFTRLDNPAKAAVDAFDDQAAAVSNLESDLIPLLGRYDELTAQSELSGDEQKELSQVIADIGNITPTAITAIDEYGNALSINADKSREFLQAEKARLEFVNKEAIKALEDEIEGLQSLRKVLSEAVESGRGGLLNVEYDATTLNNFRKDVGDITRDLKGAQAELARLTGGNLDSNEDEGPARTLSPTPEERAAQAASAENLRKQRESQAKQALKDRQRQLEQLAEALQSFEDEQSLARLSDDDRALEQVRRRYQQEIDVALALEAQGITAATEAKKKLIELRDQELLELSIAQGQAIFDAEEAQAIEQEEIRKQREAEFAVARFEAQQEIREATREVLLGEEELALIELEEQYDKLLELARQYGLDTMDIERAHAEEKARIRQEFSDKNVKATAEEAKAMAENYAKSYSSIASIIGSAIQLVGSESKDAVALQKVLTLAQIAFNTASAITAATAAGAAAGPFPANLAAIATGVATVLGNIAQARSVLAEVPQFYGGGFVKAIGAQDGRTYNARYIGQPATGLLPHGPVLVDTSIGPVLGNERGTEYFVNHTDMQKPQVLNHVRAINNIVKYRQFMDGGSTAPIPSGSTSSSEGIDLQKLTAATDTLTNAVNQLVTVLQSPIYATIDDDEAINLRDRINELVTASGGTL